MKYRSSSLTGDGITMAVAAGAATLRKTIEDDDAYVMGTADSLEVEKLSVRGTVGEVEQDENGKYKPETYKLDPIRVRFMAPSAHHTMGGVWSMRSATCWITTATPSRVSTRRAKSPAASIRATVWAATL